MFGTLPLARLTPAARTLYTNARDLSEVAALLADPYGYGPDDYADGLALVEEVQKLSAVQSREYGEQFAATSAVESAENELRTLYRTHRRLARTRHARGTSAYAALGLTGQTPDARAALIAETDDFYRMLTDDPALADGIRGLNADAIARDVALVEQTRAALDAQHKETGQAQRATSQRDDAVARLRAHASELAQIAKIALSDHPQLRETLGLRERT